MSLESSKGWTSLSLAKETTACNTTRGVNPPALLALPNPTWFSLFQSFHSIPNQLISKFSSSPRVSVSLSFSPCCVVYSPLDYPEHHQWWWHSKFYNHQRVQLYKGHHLLSITLRTTLQRKERLHLELLELEQQLKLKKKLNQSILNVKLLGLKDKLVNNQRFWMNRMDLRQVEVDELPP